MINLSAVFFPRFAKDNKTLSTLTPNRGQSHVS